ncbi:MAG TPA: hypothetical protein VFP80_16650 [Thermoanaerobaculia bacterium]|nr:hypothetical protein [Thermoanaerobaculia bacterium]
MNKWTVRIVGLLLLLVFALMFAQMHNTLRRMQRQQENAAPSR